MALTLTTPPALEPISLAEAKSQLRVDLADDDTLIGALITAARQYAEDFCARALITQTWTLTLDGWPQKPGQAIEIPRPPLQVVNSIKYLDTAGASTTWAPASYIEDIASEPGRVVPAYGQSWPTAALYPVGAIRVEYDAGYGDDAVDVPQTIRQALLLLIGHWYEHREEAVSESFAGRLDQIPLGAQALLWPYRVALV